MAAAAVSVSAILLEKTLVYTKSLDEKSTAEDLVTLADFVMKEMKHTDDPTGHCAITIEFETKTKSVKTSQLLNDVPFETVVKELKGSPRTIEEVYRQRSINPKYTINAIIVGFTGTDKRRTILC